MYNYTTQKPFVFTDEGQKMLFKVRDQAKAFADKNGRFNIEQATNGLLGSSWDRLTCIDRLAELGEIREIKQPGEVFTQHKVFSIY